MLYDADYYRIIVNEYGYDCRAVDDYEHHASFHMYLWGRAVYIYLYLYLYIYMCVCVCVCVSRPYDGSYICNWGSKNKINETSINKIQYSPPPPKKKKRRGEKRRGGGGGGEKRKKRRRKERKKGQETILEFG